MRSFNIDARRSLEDLHDGFLSLNLKDLSTPDCSVRKSEFYDFIVRGEFDVVEDNEGPGKRTMSTGPPRR